MKDRIIIIIIIIIKASLVPQGKKTVQRKILSVSGYRLAISEKEAWIMKWGASVGKAVSMTF